MRALFDGISPFNAFIEGESGESSRVASLSASSDDSLCIDDHFRHDNGLDSELDTTLSPGFNSASDFPQVLVSTGSSLERSFHQANDTLSDDQVICALFEGDYHLGFAVFVNSIIRSGFSGLVYAGHGGELPPWTEQLKRVESAIPNLNVFELPGGARLALEKMRPQSHFTNYKPQFMLDLIRRRIATKLLWYFDPDITVRCSWNFFERWTKYGISICSEIVNGSMPERHPLRCMWAESAKSAGWGEPTTTHSRYFNAGFVGLNIKYVSFLERWKDGISIAATEGTDLSRFMAGSREQPYHIPDQDVLNLCAMYAKEPISPIGPEGMGFEGGGFTMYHSAGDIKTWRKSFYRLALQARPPSNADKHYIECASGPIWPHSKSELKAMLRAVKICSVIGRFYKRA